MAPGSEIRRRENCRLSKEGSRSKTDGFGSQELSRSPGAGSRETRRGVKVGERRATGPRPAQPWCACSPGDQKLQAEVTSPLSDSAPEVPPDVLCGRWKPIFRRWPWPGFSGRRVAAVWGCRGQPAGPLLTQDGFPALSCSVCFHAGRFWGPGTSLYP